MTPAFAGSTVAMVIGAVSVAPQFSHISTWIDWDSIIGGSAAIVGAMAYGLTKQRRLGLRPNSATIRIAEGVLLAVVCAIPAIQGLMGVDFVTRPWSNLLIPVWTLSAYVYARLKPGPVLPSIR